MASRSPKMIATSSLDRGEENGQWSEGTGRGAGGGGGGKGGGSGAVKDLLRSIGKQH